MSAPFASLLSSNDLEDAWESYSRTREHAASIAWKITPCLNPLDRWIAVKDEIRRLLREYARKRAHNRQAKIHRVRRAIQRTTAYLEVRLGSDFRLLELHRATRDLQQAHDPVWKISAGPSYGAVARGGLVASSVHALDNISMALHGVITG
ncbi:MAG: hypothetical protein DHS80DRAFT_31275 [Piptocephalis tieghemiana]|nr:MAG: hypothetical protein DHS80DRAFT_31275 [Piptocephalis tieghemiana]